MDLELHRFNGYVKEDLLDFFQQVSFDSHEAAYTVLYTMIEQIKESKMAIDSFQRFFILDRLQDAYEAYAESKTRAYVILWPVLKMVDADMIAALQPKAEYEAFKHTVKTSPKKTSLRRGRR